MSDIMTIIKSKKWYKEITLGDKRTNIKGAAIEHINK
jgi:hypothetical protein